METSETFCPAYKFTVVKEWWRNSGYRLHVFPFQIEVFFKSTFIVSAF